MTNILIRTATSASDITMLQALFRDYAGHLAANPSGAANICLENFEREIAALPQPYIVLLLAAVDEQPAGCVAVKPLKRPGEQACEMKRLWVNGEYRGLGLGRKLIAAAMDHARESGFSVLYLDTVPAAMPEANRLYDSLGFERIDRYNRNPVPDVVFFRRAL